MMKHTIYVLLALLSIPMCIAFAQETSKTLDEDDGYNITPPSPTAYELGKYGQIPVSYFTGTANISIPLYSYNCGDLNVPIGFSYNSNGIKVDQLETNVGLGWSLNCGGVITRIVKDEPDEDSYQFFPGDEIHDVGPYSPIAMQYFMNTLTEGMDNEADIYMFNFDGYSGKFVYDNEKRIITMPYQDLKISPYISNDEICFKITTSKGISYFFSEIEETSTLKTLEGKNSSGFEPDDLNPPIITAWYLTQIAGLNGDIISFQYEFTDYLYKNSMSQMHIKSPYSGYTHCGSTSCGSKNFLETYDNYSHIYGKRITQISSNNPINGTIDFEYGQPHSEITGYDLLTNINLTNENNEIKENYSFNYLTTQHKRMFLTNVVFKNQTKKYEFSYIEPELLCERNSFDQDYWGYFNNKSNNYLVPQIPDHFLYTNSPWAGNRNPDPDFAQKGLLYKIKYPTGGTTELSYEANSYWGQKTIYPPLAELDLGVETTDSEPFMDQDIKTTPEIQFTQEIQINASVAFNDNSPNCDTTDYPWVIMATIRIKDLESNEYINLFRFSSIIGYYSVGNSVSIYPGQNEALTATFEEGVAYEVSLNIYKPCQIASLSLHYYDQDVQIIDQDIITGGMRIKRITSTESVSENNNIQSFYYNTYNNLNKSSGHPGSKGYYISKKVDRKQCLICGYIDCEYYILSSNSLIPLVNTGNNNIYYQYVTVSHGGDNFENGGETHEYIINRDVQGNPIVGYEYIQNGIAWSNTGWNNGLEKSVLLFEIENSTQKSVKQTSNFYKNDERNLNHSYSYAVSKNFDIICQTPIIHVCTQHDLDYTKDYYTCDGHPGKSHVHALIPGYPTMCVQFGSHNILHTLRHPCYTQGLSIGDTVFNLNAIENLNVIEYQNLSYWHYLDSTIVRSFDQNGSNPVSSYKKYIYNNEEHIQLSQDQTIDSKGDIIEGYYYYPGDYDNIENFSTLIGKNIISKPVKTFSTNNNNIINGSIFKYDYDGSVIEINKYENSILLAKSAHDPAVVTSIPDNFVKKTDITYHPVTKKPIEYLSVDNYPVTYLWGYNNTQVVAKIENATFDAVEIYLDCTYNELQNKTDGDLLTIFENLRNNPDLPNAMITSYTYEPLVGMKTETDPSSKTIYYNYDDFNRLETIKDQDGNIIKHIDYNYKDQ